ncbi:MAG: hypothetical protein ACAH20_00640 [Methylobacteriaceae bacterium]|uniref:hypothetical protein n=1 Tax=Methylorubrum extorquens TaxID=408 RepID=UPI000158F1DA|nr:hypothetical protein [Methylorubrum extorquens]KQO92435.1 hypothetical protein ASF36_17055 [Methylobacterium sp. Leaf90]KQP92885.1 hypothetical protein ASF55_21365 [Methylobacterium sp. Leaf119]MBA9070099.1 hypothetical protein [Methylobacterium sp. RAS18]ABY32225.1 hypothetical protein Mext_3853 [Methylorubrum extorquens PA1]MCP1538281.1 hypothetical protein [Methylorubrum extorquens]
MSFTVSAGTASRVYSWQHGSLLSALEQGLSLTTSGMSDVRIVDSEGRSHSPAALYQRVFGQQPTDEAAPPRARAA